MATLMIGDRRLDLVQGDITEQATDAIVNPASHALLGSGGVENAIQRRGGPAILEECRRIRQLSYPNGLPTGEAVLTAGGSLRARHVIHTVGPLWRGGLRDEERLLRAAYERSLELACDHGLESIAFPSISTGAHGFPIARAARIALSTIVDHLRVGMPPHRVRLVLRYPHDLRVYRDALHRMLPSLPADAGLAAEA